MSDPIYLDFNATTPIAPEVLDAMIPALREAWGNPSSTHPIGLRARQAVEKARRQVAGLLHCDPEEVIFTSGGTESDNAAIIGVSEALADRGKHLVTSDIEHPAVEEACRYLESRGWQVTRVSVDRSGLVDPGEVADAVRGDTTLISVMHANNETGAVQPIEEISHIARAHGIPFHTDAAQSAGKISVRVSDLGVDLLTIAGHKIYAPKGVGALYLRSGTPFAGFMRGAGHESGRRAGTENTAQIVALGAACELAAGEIDSRRKHMAVMRDRLVERLRENFPDLVVHAEGAERLPNTACVAIPGADANTLLGELEGVAASAGAACHAGGTEPSAVLTAMGVDTDMSLCTLRLTTGRTTTADEIDTACDRISAVASRLRGDKVDPEGTGEDDRRIKLTRYTHGLGCACKLRPRLLEEVLSGIELPTNPRVLVGASTADDAGVWRIGDGRVLVASVDFFTPVVDDPTDFGRIAAANALSDIYAMGAEPWFALNLVAFPEARLPTSVLREILEGASSVCAEAGVAIIGGHTIEDTEPKFGMCVIGETSEDEVWTNSGALPGDVLILTKPIGTGLLSTALKRGSLSAEIAKQVVDTMATLNGTAAKLARSVGGVHACTDITGFGLLGHLHEMTAASGVEVELEAGSVPALQGAREAVGLGSVPGGTLGNREHLESGGAIVWAEAIGETDRLLMCDAQTSGGLLLSVDPEMANKMVNALLEAGTPCAAPIGKVTGTGNGRIRVI